MQENDFQERRSSPRFYAKVPVVCVDAATNLTCLAKTHELSANGMRLVINDSINPLTLLNMCINMPDNGERINIKGEVVWSRKIEGGQSMIGIRLKDCTLKPVPIVLRSIQANL